MRKERRLKMCVFWNNKKEKKTWRRTITNRNQSARFTIIHCFIQN
jgi:hypothetical protein